MPHAAKDKYHGTNGPIHTSFNDHYMPMEEDFCKAAFETGGAPNKLHDAWSGDHYGFYSSLGAVDRTHDKGNRSYAATGYLKPNMNRPNLRVLVDSHASKILLKQDGSGEPTASGVEFMHGDQKYEVHASREVILSGGVIGTPQLLELSGVGDPEVLKEAGIDCIVKNEKVGANFQDHVLGGMLFDLKEGVKSMDELHNEEYAKSQQKIYDEEQQGPYGSPGMLMGFVSYSSIVDSKTLEDTIADIKKNSLAKTEFEKAQEKVIVDQLTNPTFANIQTFCIPCRLDLSAGSSQIQFFSAPPKGVNQVSLLVCLEHPLSRGSVHITSSNPLDHPRIDPGYFRNSADLKIMAAGIAWMDKVSKHPLLQKSLGKRVQPAEEYSLDTEQERMDYVRDHVSTQYHLIGTAAMGQVVDDQLKVIGVKGLRVVDASVFPGHVSGNIMSTTYAVAEKGADIIKADDGRYDLSRVDSVVH
jgi:choline dehydrogenase-like flavoprotein